MSYIYPASWDFLKIKSKNYKTYKKKLNRGISNVSNLHFNSLYSLLKTEMLPPPCYAHWRYNGSTYTSSGSTIHHQNYSCVTALLIVSQNIANQQVLQDGCQHIVCPCSQEQHMLKVFWMLWWETLTCLICEMWHYVGKKN